MGACNEKLNLNFFKLFLIVNINGTNNKNFIKFCTIFYFKEDITFSCLRLLN